MHDRGEVKPERAAPTSEICDASAREMVGLIANRHLSPVEVTDAVLRRIEDRNSLTNAFVTVAAEQAMTSAHEAERKLTRNGALPALHGVPVAIKDLEDTAGLRTTYGSVPFADFTPATDATVVRRLKHAGAIVIGKTNTPEFGHKGITDSLLHGPTSTPFATEFNSGGSSGGSAAAVASGLVPLAQGSDAGGSIRIPAAWCGVVGVKPTYGRVASAARPDAFNSLSPCLHSGPLARTVADAALMLGVICGPDRRDPLSLPDDGFDPLAALTQPIDGLRIAYLPDLGGFPVDPRVRDVVGDAAAILSDAVASVEETSIAWPCDVSEITSVWLRHISRLYNGMTQSFRAAGLDLIADHRADLPPEFVALLEPSERMTAASLHIDNCLRTQLLDAVEDLFDHYDILLSPTVGALPVRNAAKGTTLGPKEIDGARVEPTIGWALTHPFNLTGHPATSVPAGITADGWPVGLQVIARRFDDAAVLAVCAAIERLRPWAPPANPSAADREPSLAAQDRRPRGR